MKLLAKTIEGLEEVLAAELQRLGAGNIEKLNRAVGFEGDLAMLYRSNYCCRTALRVLMPIAWFTAGDQQALYREVHKIPWEKYLSINQTFAVDGVVSYSTFTHSGFVALKTKDAIVDRFRERTGRRPDVDPERPDILVNIHVFKDQCTVSLDSSGSSLHLRGYRRASIEAPLSEVLASGLILLSGWDHKTPLLDPMCGSGTILTEAAMIASHIPPGYFRDEFGFMKWNGFERDLWNGVRKEANAQICETTVEITGADIDIRAIRASERNIRMAGFEQKINLVRSDFNMLPPPYAEGMIITNPPYGERLEVEDLVSFYQNLGNVFKRSYSGYTAWILGSDMQSMKFVGLRPSRKIKVMNGPLECRFVRFDLYEGSKRRPKDIDNQGSNA